MDRQRTMEAEGHLLIILHAVPNPDDMFRNRRLTWSEPDAIWHDSEFQGGTDALKRPIQEYQVQLENFDEKVDQAINICRTQSRTQSHTQR